MTQEKKNEVSASRRLARNAKCSAKRSKTAKSASRKIEAMNDHNITVHNIGKADVLCEFRGSLKFSHESNSFCCRRGNVVLPQLLKPPDTILELHKNNMFLKNIVAFNNLMALASLGCEEPEDGIVGYRSTFKVQGKIYHRIGSLLPDSGTEPKFGQPYFYDIDHELENRMKLMSNLDQKFLEELLHIQRLSSGKNGVLPMHTFC